MQPLNLQQVSFLISKVKNQFFSLSFRKANNLFCLSYSPKSLYCVGAKTSTLALTKNVCKRVAVWYKGEKKSGIPGLRGRRARRAPEGNRRSVRPGKDRVKHATLPTQPSGHIPQRPSPCPDRISSLIQKSPYTIPHPHYDGSHLLHVNSFFIQRCPLLKRNPDANY